MKIGESQKPDAALIQAAQNGDRAAQTRLLLGLQDAWFRMSMSLLHDPELARDASQETAYRFLAKLPQYRGESSLSTWSLGIAINVAREMRRKRRPTANLDDVDPPSTSADVTSLPAISAEEKGAIAAALADLSHRQREVILLRFFEEKSTEETAAVMDCAPGTVKATLHQALRILKKKIQPLR